MSNEAEPRPGQIDAEKRGDQRIENVPTRQPDEPQSNRNTDASPEIGQNVLAVGQKRQRSIALARTDQKQTERGIGNTRGQGDGKAHVSGMYLGAENQTERGLVDDEHGGKRDEAPFEH